MGEVKSKHSVKCGRSDRQSECTLEICGHGIKDLPAQLCISPPLVFICINAGLEEVKVDLTKVIPFPGTYGQRKRGIR